MEIPNELDGANVILYTDNSLQNQFGYVDTINENNVNIGVTQIAAIAICKYIDGVGYYLFSCNCNWEVIGDTFHDTLEEAKEHADVSFFVKEDDWNIR
ncbi:hypothetical protein [Bacillus sp. EAC]|uniref:hypothetical protein n=1 Tax=Bacillus sp. EAC TaxID=1978338 RepID=UPI000B42F7E7|nr:hypothetical protein [Bacillus sp. EAC]